MEALDFLKEYKRMCSNCSHFCDGCPLNGEQCLSTGIRNKTDGEFLTITSMVEQWSKEHPIITNAMKFKEVFGHKPQSINEIIFCPPVTPGALECDRVDCMKCLEWWDKQYKEPENA